MGRSPSKFDEIRPLAIQNQIRNIYAHTKFGGNPLMFTQVIIRKLKYGHVWWITSLKFDEICPLAIPNQISPILSLVKTHGCLLKLISENDLWMDRLMMDGQTDTHMDVQRETIIPCHYRVVGYKNECKLCRNL